MYGSVLTIHCSVMNNFSTSRFLVFTLCSSNTYSILHEFVPVHFQNLSSFCRWCRVFIHSLKSYWLDGISNALEIIVALQCAIALCTRNLSIRLNLVRAGLYTSKSSIGILAIQRQTPLLWQAVYLSKIHSSG